MEKMDVPDKDDLGMVWVGDVMLQNDSNDLLIDHQVDPPFFTDSDPHQLCDDDITCRNQMEMDGFMMLDELETPRWCMNDMPEEEILIEGDPIHNTKVNTASTQTVIQNAPPGSRKIKPVKHPGLKLQTPIAYQRDTDLNVIPIQKDGRAVCEKCGAIGVKHAFYTRERRFCSLACARSAAEVDSNEADAQHFQQHPLTQSSQSENKNSFISWPNDASTEQQLTYISSPQPPQTELLYQTQAEISRLPSVFTLLPEDEPLFITDKKAFPHLACTYDWANLLNDPNFNAAPTTNFKHAPMAEFWSDISVGVKVELENIDSYDYCEDFPDSFWIATVLKIAGYKALVRYEGFIDDDSKDFWINLCSPTIHPVGWCATRGKPLIPPQTIKDKYSDWKEFLVRRLTGARTLPSNFSSKVHESHKSRFRCDLTLEVVDKERITQVKVATIEKIIGKRLQLRYFDSKSSHDSFWCHEESPLIHPVGWAHRVGQTLSAPSEYHDRTLKGLREKDDATADLFPICDYFPLSPNCMFQQGMKLEAIDPLNLADICVATVMQVLNEGYLMICVDFWNDLNSTTEDWFCYHMTSPCIFPAGYCHANKIPLTPPRGYTRSTFEWNQYLQETGCIAAPAELFRREVPDHGFKVGMKLEAADLMNPRLVCVATITHVVDRLLKVHFDGWENDFDQWLDCHSCDIYPVGWCELVYHKLEPPYTAKHASRGEHRGSRKRGRKPNATSSLSTKTCNSESPYYNNFQDTENNGAFVGARVMDCAQIVTHDLSIPNSICLPELWERDITEHPLGENTFSGITCDLDGINSAETTSSIKDDCEDEECHDVNDSGEDDDINNIPCSLNKLNVNVGYNQNSSQIVEPDFKPSSPSKKVIPKLVDSKGRSAVFDICPESWGMDDVAEFLKINDCSAYCDAFRNQKINGKKLLELSKEEIHQLTEMKVGPCLKIQNLIHQLKLKICPSQSRSVKNTNK